MVRAERTDTGPRANRTRKQNLYDRTGGRSMHAKFLEDPTLFDGGTENVAYFMVRTGPTPARGPPGPENKIFLTELMVGVFTQNFVRIRGRSMVL